MHKRFNQFLLWGVWGVMMLISTLLIESCGTKRPTAHSKQPTQQVVSSTSEPEPRKTHGMHMSLNQRMRAVWLTTIYGLDWPHKPIESMADVNIQKHNLTQLLDRLQACHLNTVFLQVRLRGDLIYPNGIEPLSKTMATSSGLLGAYDPLAFAVEECHKRGLQCHAWLVTFPMGTDKQVRNLSTRSVITRQPSWRVKHLNEWYLNPGMPEVRDYIAQVAAEVVQRYDVDGVHLDYVRYPQQRERFNDQKAYNQYGNGQTLDEWRRDNITETVRSVREAINLINPMVQLSAATLGKYRKLANYPKIGWTCYDTVLQDPLEWFKQDLVDFIVPMMYYKDNNFVPFLVDWHNTFGSYRVVPGLGVYRLTDGSGWDAQIIEDQMELVEQYDMPGVCFYREEHIRPNYQGNLYSYLQKSFHSTLPSFAVDRPNVEAPLPPVVESVQLKQQMLVIDWRGQVSDKASDSRLFNLYYRRSDAPNKGFYRLRMGVYGTQLIIPVKELPQGEGIELRIEAMNQLNGRSLLSDPHYFCTPPQQK